MSLRPCLDCGTLSNGSRCPQHRRSQQRVRDIARAPVKAGRYGKEHQESRAAWQRRLRAGEVISCRRGTGCLFFDTSYRIWPEDAWDLGHPDEACNLPTAPEHRRCNRYYAGALS